MKPDIIVDVSKYWDKKLEAIKCYQSQFFDPDSKEPETFVSTAEFLKLIESRGVEFGRAIGTQYAEGFTASKLLGVNSLFHLL